MIVAPELARARRNTPPAATMHSLLASATIAPRFTAAKAGSSAAAPMMATMTVSDGLAAAAMTAARPAAASTPLPASADLSSAYNFSSPITATFGRNLAACSARTETLDCAVIASTGNASAP